MTIDTGRLDRVVERARRAWRAPGVAVAVLQGEDCYVQGYGVRELGRPEAVSPDTIFAIASTSKAFCSASLAILVDEGRLGWDDLVRKHLPWFRLSDPAADSSVSLRDLLSHRTGMPRHDALWYARGGTREECVRRWMQAPASTSFRSTYEYSNIPFMAAGLVVEAVTGTTWEDFVTGRLLKPLGMDRTYLRLAQVQEDPDHASPHEKFKGRLIVAPWCPMDKECPAGGVNSCVRDLARWMRFHLNGGEYGGARIVSESALLETRRPVTVTPVKNPDEFGFDSGVNMASYCLGWSQHDYRGHIVWDHGGWIDGFTAHITLVPGSSAAIAVLANTTSGPVVGSVTRGILDAVLGLPERDWISELRARIKAESAEARRKRSEEAAKDPRRKRTRPSLPPAEYAGRYEHPAFGAVDITCEEGCLSLSWERLTVPLKHYHFDTFSFHIEQPGWKADGKATFNLNAEGRVASARLTEPLAAEFVRV